MIKKLFSGQINSVTIAALLVALSSLISRLLGIFRDRILAGEFGAGEILDVYYASFRVPDLIFNLLVLGALSAGFIPILTGLISEKDGMISKVFFRDRNHKTWILSNNVLNTLAAVLFFVSAIGIFFAPAVIKVISPGFSPEKQNLTVAVTRIMFLSPIFLGISSVFGGILQSFRMFFVYSLSPIVYNIGIIIGALFFAPCWGIYGLAWGVVFGSFLHMIIQVPSVLFLGYRYTPIMNWRDKNLRKIFSMTTARTLGLAVSQTNLVFITIIASALASGSLSIFNFANNLQSFPVGIFGISFAIAVFPVLSATAFNRAKLIENFSAVFRKILFFIVPSTVFLLTLRAQIVRVVLGSGHFDWEDTILTINTLSFFTLSLFAQAGLPLLARVFYARHDSRTPFFVGLFSVLLNVILCLYLPKVIMCQQIFGVGEPLAERCAPMGVAGLALAFSISNIFNFILLWIILRMEIGDMDEMRILKSAVKFSIAAVFCGLSVQMMKYVLGTSVEMNKLWGVLLQGFAAGVVGITVYLFSCFILKSEEFFEFWDSFHKRLPKKAEVNDQGEARGI